MTKVLLTLLIIFLFLNSHSQTDSKLLKQGAELFHNKNYSEALKLFKKEFKKNPSIKVKFWIAHTYAELDQTERAKNLFLEIANSNHDGPEISMSLNNLGTAYRELKDMDSSLFYYDKAIQLFPKDHSAHFNRGLLMYHLSRFEEAKQSFDKAIDLKSDDWWYYAKRLEVCFATKNYECALRDLIKSKELNPKQDLEMNMAYCYSMMEKYEEADSIFLIIYDEKDPLILNNYGFNKHKLGKSDEAVKIIRKSLEIEPNNSYAYRNLAIIAFDKGDKSKGCELLLKAQELQFEKRYGSEVNELIQKNCK